MVDARRNVHTIELTAVCNRFNDCTIYKYKSEENAMWKRRGKKMNK